MKNPTQNFREKMNLLPQLMEELQIKSKTVMSIGAFVRKKVFYFVTFILPERIFLLFVFSQYIAYWINFMIFYLTAATQTLDAKNIWHCALTLLIRETYDFWSPLFLVFLACKHEKVAISEIKWIALVLY